MQGNTNQLEHIHKKKVAGASTYSKSYTRFPSNYPSIITQADGCNIYDISHKKYIDFTSALGAIVLGYANQTIDQSVLKLISQGHNLTSYPSDHEAICGDTLTDHTNTENCLFLKTGTDAINASIRIAKSYTKRNDIVYCKGGYHGWGSEFAVSQPINSGVNHCLASHISSFKYNDEESLKSSITKNTAAILMEPIMLVKPYSSFLSAVQDIANDNNSLLIMDEMITYPRTAESLYQYEHGCVADLTCIGKGIGNGYSIAAVVGSEEYLNQRRNEKTFISGTFFGESIGMVAATSCLTQCRDNFVSESIFSKGAYLKSRFNNIASSVSTPIKMIGEPHRMVLEYPNNEIKTLFLQEMASHNILFGNVIFINNAMTKSDMDSTLSAVYSVLRDINCCISNDTVLEAITGPLCADLKIRPSDTQHSAVPTSFSVKIGEHAAE